jgi:hypothetical protein
MQKQLSFHPSMDALINGWQNVYFLQLITNYEKPYNFKSFKMVYLGESMLKYTKKVIFACIIKYNLWQVD